MAEGDPILALLLVGLWVWAIVLIAKAPPYKPPENEPPDGF